MCDTFVALKEATANGSVLLAKSADTEINEAQHVLKLPRRDYPDGTLLRITHIVIPQARRTHETLIDKSFWLYGGEIGVNEHGVAIGNEAVFSTEAYASERDGVVLIDILRLILERCGDRHEAVELVSHLLVTHGQGGNCELRGNSHFDGSFIVSDQSGAVIIETAGKEWAAKEVSAFDSISNGYTIGRDWTRCSMKSNGSGRIDFQAEVGDPDRTRCVAASERRGASHDFLARHAGKITVRTMADLLRYTGEADYEPHLGEFPRNICMHAAPHPNRLWQATGALISDTRGDDIMAWVTATSGTDVSIFKPFFFGTELPDLGPMPRESFTPDSYWWKHELLHRRAMADYRTLMPEIRDDFEAIEDSFFRDSEVIRKGSRIEKQAFVYDCWRRADEACASWTARLEKRNYFVPNDAYRAMWNEFNRAAALPL